MQFLFLLMLARLTPFSSIFLFMYLSIILLLPIISDFYFFWLFIELCILLFIGFCYTIFINSYSQLIFFFLVQTAASFRILVFFTLSIYPLLILSFLFKLAMFPFMYWYLNVIYRFPNSALFIVSTVYKLPTLLLYTTFVSSFSSLLVYSIAATFLLASILMFNVSDFRYLLIVSSTTSSSWFLLAMLYSNIILFIFFFLLYSLTLLFLLSSMGPLTKLSPSLYSTSFPARITLFLALSNFASFPPSPMFLLKLAILYNFSIESGFMLFNELLLFLILNVLVIASYIKCFFKFFTLSYSNPSFLLV